VIRTSAPLFALLLALAAPLQAQAPAAIPAAAATPLPSVLVPSADVRGGGAVLGAARPDRLRGMWIGMAIGCAVFGTLAAVDNDQYDGPLTAGLIGCAWGTIPGAIVGFAWLGGR
jgi:hypothetical protein